MYDESDLSELECEEQDEAWDNGLRRDFGQAVSRALVAAFETSPTAERRDGESDADWEKRLEATADWLEDGAGISDVDLDELSYQLQDVTNVYWRDAWIDVERLVKGLPQVKALLKAAMGDAKYDFGIYRWIDPNQLSLELA